MIGKFPQGIDRALIHLTGTIVTWWGRIEGLLVRDLITLRQCNPEFAAKKPFPVQTGNVIDQWTRLQRTFWEGHEKRLERIEEDAVELGDLAGDRNILVHYFWPYGGTEGKEEITLQSVKPRKGDNDTLEFKQATISVEILDDINERLVRLYHRIMADSMNLISERNRRDGPPIGRVADE